MLTISGEKELNKEQHYNVRYAAREFSYQSFSRTLVLQKVVIDKEKKQGSCDDGVVHLVIPKKNKQNKKARGV